MLIPKKGEVWVHNKTSGHYQIMGSVFNTITDQVDVKYKPLYECEFEEFSRQIKDHPKAWTTPNADGSPRFYRVGTADQGHHIDWYRPPER